MIKKQLITPLRPPNTLKSPKLMHIYKFIADYKARGT